MPWYHHKRWPPGDLPEKLIHSLGSGDRAKQYQDSCDPEHMGWLAGRYGVDLAACGAPGFVGRRDFARLGMPSLSCGMKLFLHTPQADELFLDRLASEGMRQPAAVVAEIGVWGARGTRRSDKLTSTLTEREEIDYFVQLVESRFRKSRIIWVVDHSVVGGPSLDKQIIRYFRERPAVPHVAVMDKYRLLDARPAEMPCRHGCAGPLMRVLALMVMAAVER